MRYIITDQHSVEPLHSSSLSLALMLITDIQQPRGQSDSDRSSPFTSFEDNILNDAPYSSFHHIEQRTLAVIYLTSNSTLLHTERLWRGNVQRATQMGRDPTGNT